MTRLKIQLGVAAALMLGAMSSQADPLTFDFSCDPSIDSTNCAGDEGGTVSISSTESAGIFEYLIDVDNTSDASDPDAIITGFGFDFDPNFNPNDVIANSFSATIIDSNGDGIDVTSSWSISAGAGANGESYNGISLSFIDFDVTTNGASDAIVNRRTGTWDGQFVFRSTQDLLATGAFLRMQTTGQDGEGSLKLISDTHTTDVSEPGMLGLLGIGLAGVAFARRRRQF